MTGRPHSRRPPDECAAAHNFLTFTSSGTPPANIAAVSMRDQADCKVSRRLQRRHNVTLNAPRSQSEEQGEVTEPTLITLSPPEGLLCPPQRLLSTEFISMRRPLIVQSGG